MGDFMVLVGVWQRIQEMPHAIQPSAFLVVGFNHRPWGIGRVGVEEHGLFGLGVIVPAIQRLDVDWAKLPVLEGVVATGDEAAQLLVSTHREPIFE